MSPQRFYQQIEFAVQDIKLCLLQFTKAKAVRRSVADFPPRRPGFKPSSGHVGFVVDKVARG
jgi:hypothetical protein